MFCRKLLICLNNMRVVFLAYDKKYVLIKIPFLGEEEKFRILCCLRGN